MSENNLNNIESEPLDLAENLLEDAENGKASANLDFSDRRTLYLYFAFGSGVLFAFAIAANALAAIIIVGLIFAALTALLVYAIYSFKKTKQEQWLFSTALRVHIQILFFILISIAPFVGVLNINELDEPIKGLPFNPVGIIALGYFVVALILGIPLMILVHSVKSKQDRIQKILEKLNDSAGNATEKYNRAKHGDIIEKKTAMSLSFISACVMFVVMGIIIMEVGFDLFTSSASNLVPAIIIISIGLLLDIIGIITCIVCFKSRARKRRFEEAVQNFYLDGRGYITTAKVFKASIVALLHRSMPKRPRKSGYKLTYVFMDDGKLRKGHGYFDDESAMDKALSFGAGYNTVVSSSSIANYFEDITIVFDKYNSAILSVQFKAKAE